MHVGGGLGNKIGKDAIHFLGPFSLIDGHTTDHSTNNQ